MIEVEGLSKSFLIKRDIFHFFLLPRRIYALNSVHLKVNRGEALALLGPNGAGKTTLLKIICGLILPERGMIKVKGGVAYFSGETYGFYPQLTAKQNLEFFATIYNLSSHQIRERIKNYSQILEVEDLDKPFWQYSTGTKHRLSLLRTLILEKEIIIMDEPTKSLDPLTAKEFRKLMQRLAKEFKKTILFATHFLEEAETVADRIAIMNRGEILLIKNIKEIQTSLKDLYGEIIKNDIS